MRPTSSSIKTDVARLASELSEIINHALTPISRPGRYALLDFPDHSNVGDSAIWLGELALLQRLHGRAPSYVSATANFSEDELDGILPESTIYIHGGGNFGDLYPKHQTFRERVMRRYGSRVVQLPQSLHYSPGADLSSVKLAARAGSTIMVRDQSSFKLASDLGFQPTLAPDCAFGMGALDRLGAPVQDVLILKRSDKESASVFKGGVDWLDEPQTTRRTAKLMSLFHAGLPNREHYYRVLARRRVNRGLRLLSRGRTVATDRLHAHILSLLLGIPHCAADNSTGKIHGFIDQWTGTSPLVTKVPDLSQFAAG